MIKVFTCFEVQYKPFQNSDRILNKILNAQHMRIFSSELALLKENFGEHSGLRFVS